MTGLPGLTELTTRIAGTGRAAGRPVVVGVAGYGGSGKSTLARHLVGAVNGAVRLRGDDFLDPDRSHRRSADWNGVERDRLATEVFEPFRAGRSGAFRPYDWTRRALGAPQPLPRADVLVVDVIVLFHPEVLHLLDVTVWCDIDLALATERGKARDALLGRQHERLWDEVWVHNERDFDERFAPRGVADVLSDTT